MLHEKNVLLLTIFCLAAVCFITLKREDSSQMLLSAGAAPHRLLKKDSWIKKTLEDKLKATTGPSDLVPDIKVPHLLSNDSSDDRTLRTLIASGRHFIIIKLARSGSSWLGNEITAAAQKIGFNVTIQNEVTNCFIPFQRPCKPLRPKLGIPPLKGKSKLEVCQESIEYAMKKLAEGGFTLNPTKGGYTTERLKGKTTCWQMLMERIQDENIHPIVILWRRTNFVARAVSSMYSDHVKRTNECPHAFHLELCPKFKKYPINYDPKTLLITTRRMAHGNRDLIKFAVDFKVPYYALTYEEVLDYSGGGHPRLVNGTLLDKQLRHCQGNQCEESHMDIPPGSFAKAYLQKKIKNWPEVYKHIEENRPDLLPMLLEE